MIPNNLLTRLKDSSGPYWKAIGAAVWALLATVSMWLTFPLYPGMESAIITMFSLFGPPLTVYFSPGNKKKVESDGR